MFKNIMHSISDSLICTDNGFKIWLPARTAVCLEKVKKPRKAKEVVAEPVAEEKPKAKRTRKTKKAE